MINVDRPLSSAHQQQLVLDTAERLFVDRGFLSVSNRQIGEALGHPPRSVAGYHYGTHVDLVRAITRRFTAEVELSRVAMLAALDDSSGVHDLLACLVVPWTDNFATRGPQSRFARLCAQAGAHPLLRAVMVEEASSSPSLQQTLQVLNRHLPLMPAAAADERGEIVGRAILQACAEREGAVAHGAPTLRSTWRDAARGLVDGLVGIWTAPTTSVRRAQPTPRPRTS